jgi:phosphoribosylglycinamide formyltransferase-1
MELSFLERLAPLSILDLSFNVAHREPSVRLVTEFRITESQHPCPKLGKRAPDSAEPARVLERRARSRAASRAAIVRRVAESLPIAVLVSGTGTNLQALLDTIHGREAHVVAVASSVGGVHALARAAEHGIPNAVFARGDYPNRAVRDDALADWLDKRGPRLVVLAGYMELLGGAFLRRFPNAVINVHPSLLPAFPGIRAIADALAYGVTVFGVTVHFVDDGVDTGAVILQRAIELPYAREQDEVLSALRPLEHALLGDAVRMFARGELAIDPSDPRHPRRGPTPMPDTSADWPTGLRARRSASDASEG